MSDLRIGVILGSTRPGRNGKGVADWVIEKTACRPGATYELVDLADYPLPLLDEPAPASMQQYTKEHTKRWAAKVAEFDGFVFVSPEYNHSTSAVLKNALDFLNVEWNDKAAALVTYGSVGGARAAEHLRAILSELQVAHVRQQMTFSLFTDFTDFTTFTPGPQHDDFLPLMLDQLEAWAGALRTLRSPAGASPAA